MNSFDPRALVIEVLADIAPDVDPNDRDADLHDVLGLDSMDLLNVTAAVVLRTGIDIPERDLPGLRTIRQLEEYLARSV
jgi:acyl carrier protein